MAVGSENGLKRLPYPPSGSGSPLEGGVAALTDGERFCPVAYSDEVSSLAASTIVTIVSRTASGSEGHARTTVRRSSASASANTLSTHFWCKMVSWSCSGGVVDLSEESGSLWSQVFESVEGCNETGQDLLRSCPVCRWWRRGEEPTSSLRSPWGLRPYGASLAVLASLSPRRRGEMLSPHPSTGSRFPLNAQHRDPLESRRCAHMVEAGGIEPPSRCISAEASTCIVCLLVFLGPQDSGKQDSLRTRARTDQLPLNTARQSA